jgi:hypothetical protein
MVRNPGRVTRFVVMAMLQAARAESLGLPRDSAYSWGLNRAVFYAAAKRGFKEGTSAGGEGKEKAPERPLGEVYHLGDDEAYRDPDSKQLIFAIGGEDQTAEAFAKQVASRFGNKENFQAAWKEAVRIVSSYDRATLESRQRFYADVYKPRRDELSDTWTQRYSPAPKTR